MKEHRLVRRVSRRGGQAHQGGGREEVRARRMLSLNNIEVIYDGVILVLKGVSLNVREGGITTLLGANGAGKTTTLKAISGLLAVRARRRHQGLDRVQERADRPSAPARGGPARHRAGVRRPAGLRAPDDRGEPDRRRAHPEGPAARRGRDRARLRLLSASQRTARRPGRATCPAASSRCWSSAAR